MTDKPAGPVVVGCPRCYGHGWIKKGADMKECPKCLGSGESR